MITIDKLIQIIDERLEIKGLNATQVSMDAVGKPDAIRTIRNRSMPKLDRWEKICKELDINFYTGLPEELCEQTDRIPHLGNIAAGGTDCPADGHLILNPQDNGDKVSAPAGIGLEEAAKFGGMFALNVKGQSMLPRYNNDDTIYMYQNDPVRFDFEKLIGKDCAITLTEKHDHAVYLKCLRRSDNGEKGYFNLESLNKEWDVMVNIPVEFALPVRFVQHKI